MFVPLVSIDQRSILRSLKQPCHWLMNDYRNGVVVMVVMVVMMVMMAAVMVIRLRKRTCREQHDHREQQNFFHKHIRIPSVSDHHSISDDESDLYCTRR